MAQQCGMSTQLASLTSRGTSKSQGEPPSRPKGGIAGKVDIAGKVAIARKVDTAMRAQRVTRDEVLSALRAAGRADADGVGAVVLETDGSLSVLDARAGRAAHPTLSAAS